MKKPKKTKKGVSEVDSHKAGLSKLQEIDPEFYEFLQENDKKLLEFDVSDNEENEEVLHKPDGELEVASDESDFEQDDKEVETAGPKLVTNKLLKEWKLALTTDKSSTTIINVIGAFRGALLSVSGDNSEEVPKFKVTGSAVFNGVIELCVLHLGSAIRQFLGVQINTKIQLEKCKKFPKLKRALSDYFTDLLKLLSGVTSSNMLTVLLKHLHFMVPLLQPFLTLTKLITKKLINLWGTNGDNVSVLAFLCLLRITMKKQSGFFSMVIKGMYMTYVRNSKFVSPSTLPGINFMRRSLTEIFALDLSVTYQHAFLSIRQLAIHLRNAVTDSKKEYVQMVYNWQFINSLKLWTAFLCRCKNAPQVQSLFYPLVQICIGCIKLQPTAQYFPLRFHVVEILIELGRETGIFIPVLPFVLEVLNVYDFEKKLKQVSMKPLKIRYALRMSKSQMLEKGYAEALKDSIYALTLEYMSSQSHSIAYPELSLFAVTQFKSFLSNSSSPEFNKKIRQLLGKIKENCDFIEHERKSLSCNLNETKKIEAWESQVQSKQPPLLTFYDSWNKLRNVKRKKEMTDNDKLADYNLPVIKRVKKNDTDREKSDGNPFPSDSEEETPLVTKEKRKKKKAKTKAKVIGKIEIPNLPEQDLIEDLKDW